MNDFFAAPCQTLDADSPQAGQIQQEVVHEPLIFFVDRDFHRIPVSERMSGYSNQPRHNRTSFLIQVSDENLYPQRR
jgi:hypothetical protein